VGVLKKRRAEGGTREGGLMNPQLTELRVRRRVQPIAADDEYLLRQGILKLLAIKDSDIRLSPHV